MNWVLYSVLLSVWWVLMLLTIAVLGGFENRPHPLVVTMSVVSMTVVFLGLIVVLT